MSRAIKLAAPLKELRIHLCQTSDTSKGVREFITKHYVDIKKANPQVPILVRECSGIQPRLWARYGLGKESSVSLSNLNSEDVASQVESIARKG